MKPGDIAEVGLQSWAGVSWHSVQIERVCPKRVRVRWLGPSLLRHRTDGVYYVPLSAVRPRVAADRERQIGRTDHPTARALLQSWLAEDASTTETQEAARTAPLHICDDTLK